MPSCKYASSTRQFDDQPGSNTQWDLRKLARAQIEAKVRAKIDASDIVPLTIIEAHHGLNHFCVESDDELHGCLRRITAINLALMKFASTFVSANDGLLRRGVKRLGEPMKKNAEV